MHGMYNMEVHMAKDEKQRSKQAWYKRQRKKNPGITNADLLKGWTKKLDDAAKAEAEAKAKAEAEVKAAEEAKKAAEEAKKTTTTTTPAVVVTEVVNTAPVVTS